MVIDGFLEIGRVVTLYFAISMSDKQSSIVDGGGGSLIFLKLFIG